LRLATGLAQAAPDQAVIAKGEKIYADKKCAVCHMIKGKGGKVGPDLSAVGTKRDAVWPQRCC
jgi:mono/diheme cytochrome c family protein